VFVQSGPRWLGSHFVAWVAPQGNFRRGTGDHEPCRVKVHSDSAYIVNCFKQKWHVKWQKNGWVTASKKPVENKDLWQRLLELMKQHEVEFIKVKGHSDVELNNRCDELARAAVPR
jgi:ribonuclease HI